jgi:hypothetical protein
MKYQRLGIWAYAVIILILSGMMTAQTAVPGTDKLPDAPSATQAAAETPAAPGDAAPASAPATAKPVNEAPGYALYGAVQGLMLSSFVAAAETTQRCIGAGNCTAIPDPLRSRAAIYAVGLPVTAATAHLSYLMKRHGSHWWFVPPALLTAGNAIMAFHANQNSH